MPVFGFVYSVYFVVRILTTLFLPGSESGKIPMDFSVFD
jgi:hypothetical protein